MEKLYIFVIVALALVEGGTVFKRHANDSCMLCGYGNNGDSDGKPLDKEKVREYLKKNNAGSVAYLISLGMRHTFPGIDLQDFLYLDNENSGVTSGTDATNGHPEPHEPLETTEVTRLAERPEVLPTAETHAAPLSTDRPEIYQPTETPEALRITETPAAPLPTNRPEIYQPTETPEAPHITETPAVPLSTDRPEIYQPTETPEAPHITETPAAPLSTDRPEIYQPTETPEALEPTNRPETYQPTETTEAPHITEIPAAPLPTNRPEIYQPTETLEAPQPNERPETPQPTIQPETNQPNEVPEVPQITEIPAAPQLTSTLASTHVDEAPAIPHPAVVVPNYSTNTDWSREPLYCLVQGGPLFTIVDSECKFFDLRDSAVPPRHDDRLAVQRCPDTTLFDLTICGCNWESAVNGANCRS